MAEPKNEPMRHIAAPIAETKTGFLHSSQYFIINAGEITGISKQARPQRTSLLNATTINHI